AARAAGELEVVFDRHVAVQGRRFGQVADALAHFVGEDVHVVAAHAGGAFAGADVGGQHLHGGGLAGAVGAEKAQHLALVNVERHVFKGFEVAVELGDAFDLNHRGVNLAQHLPTSTAQARARQPVFRSTGSNRRP